MEFRVWDLGQGTIGFHKAARALQGLGERRTKWKTTTETGSVKVDVVLRVYDFLGEVLCVFCSVLD